MKTPINILAMLAVSACISTTVFAQDCPTGTQKLINASTNEVMCVTFSESPLSDQADENITETAVIDEADPEDLAIHSALQKNSAEVSLGLGYGIIAAVNIRASLGYYFNISNADGLAFSLNTDFNIRISNFDVENTLDWTVVPMVHVYGRSFRVGFGFGIGLFNTFDEEEECGKYDYCDKSDESHVSFAFKPALRFDWFLTEHISLNLNFDFPFSIDDLSYPRFSANLSVNYKF